MLDQRDGLWLYGYSPALLPRPRDWPASAHVTGYWFLDRGEDWIPPAPLQDFLTAGPAPVYVGFGSAGFLRQDETVGLALEALRIAGQRGVVGVAGQGRPVVALSDDAVGVDGIPHDWLFPRTSLTVHHVGLGTLEMALRSGRPSVLVPHYMDEPFWAQRLARLGTSPRPLPRGRLTAARLAQRIRHTLANEAMRRRARQLGHLIDSEHGSRRAVAAIEAHMGPA